MKGLYVHVPFCVRKCSYCDFYSVPVQGEQIEPYVDALVRESSSYSGMSFQTVYLGGGTPSLIGPGLLKRLLSGLGRVLDLSAALEMSMEVNPESVTRDLMQAARCAGINRLSVGVQSLDDHELENVGRIHTAGQAIEALALAKKLGFESISADLIVGLPGQCWESLRKSLDGVIALGVDHLSLYCLSLEEDTPLAQDPPANLPSDDEQAELFERARRLLIDGGFVHYEISNFAVTGHECQHNLIYWRGGEYVGLGPAAASHVDGRRFRNCPDVGVYMQGEAEVAESVEELRNSDKACEEAMLRLRLVGEGLETTALAAKYGYDAVAALVVRLQSMAREGMLERNGSTYRLTPSRVLTSNPIFAEVLG